MGRDETMAKIEEDRRKLEPSRQKMISILKKFDIKMKVDGCGCCGSPWVSFSYKGEIIIDHESGLDFDTEEEDK